MVSNCFTRQKSAALVLSLVIRAGVDNCQGQCAIDQRTMETERRSISKAQSVTCTRGKDVDLRENGLPGVSRSPVTHG